MYVPHHFVNDNREELLAFVDDTAVATLVTAGPGGLMANTVPLLRQPDADRLWGHLARPNPQLVELAAVEEALLVFNGPHGYISPNWYGDPDLVPTWNFVSVQVRGRIEIHDDREVVHDIVRRLTAWHEASFATPWTLDKVNPERLEKMLSVIVGFHVEIDEIQGKYKLSQNRSAEDLARVLAGLDAVGNSELGAVMRHQEEQDGSVTAE